MKGQECWFDQVYIYIYIYILLSLSLYNTVSRYTNLHPLSYPLYLVFHLTLIIYVT